MSGTSDQTMNDGSMNHGPDTGSNASGSQQGDSAETWDSVDSGMSEDVENALTGQGVSDRETTAEIGRDANDDGEGGVALGDGGSGTGM